MVLIVVLLSCSASLPVSCCLPAVVIRSFGVVSAGFVLFCVAELGML